jgi:hypothetical protein
MRGLFDVLKSKVIIFDTFGTFCTFERLVKFVDREEVVVVVIVVVLRESKCDVVDLRK